jgi:hypothetical protein
MRYNRMEEAQTITVLGLVSCYDYDSSVIFRANRRDRLAVRGRAAHAA